MTAVHINQKSTCTFVVNVNHLLGLLVEQKLATLNLVLQLLLKQRPTLALLMITLVC